MTYLFLFLLIFFLEHTFAQQQITYGLKVGMNLSYAKTEVKNLIIGDTYRDARLGNSIGVFSEYYLNDYLGIQLEISYANEGAEDKIPITTSQNPDGTGEFYVIDHQHDYFISKIFFKPTLNSESLNLYGILGPALKILVAEKDIWSYNLNPKKVLLGYSIGFGVLPKQILNGRVFLEFIFNSTFSNVINTDNFKLKFSSIQMNFGCSVN